MSTGNSYVDSIGSASSARGQGTPLRALQEKFRTIFNRPGKPAGEPDVEVENTLELRREYRDIVEDYCRRHGMDSSAMRVKAISLGYRRAKEVYVVLVTLTRPTFETAVQLMHLTPHMERRVGDIVGSTWLGDYSAFSGVWLHWPEQLCIPEQVRIAMHAARPEAEPGASEAAVPFVNPID